MSNKPNKKLKIKRNLKTGQFLSKDINETNDSYNKYAKKFFKNLSLPRSLKQPVPNFPYVYLWIRKDKNKIFYVGAGVKNRAWNLSRRNNLTINVIKKIGKKNVYIKIIKTKSWEEALDTERKLINKFGRFDKGSGSLTNMTEGGEGAKGRIVNIKTRNAVAESNKKRVYTAEMRENLSKKLKIIKSNVSNETRAKLSKALKGKPRPDHVKKILLQNLERGREKNREYLLSQENLDRLTNNRELAKGWHKSEEGRKIHSRVAIESWINKKKTKKNCLNCKNEYETYFPNRSKFCGNNCKASYRRKTLKTRNI